MSLVNSKLVFVSLVHTKSQPDDFAQPACIVRPPRIECRLNVFTARQEKHVRKLVGDFSAAVLELFRDYGTRTK